MEINDFKKMEFYRLPKWILKVKGLKPVDMVLYSLAMNNWGLSVKNNMVNEDGEVYFYLTHETVRAELEIGKDQVIDSIKRLVKSGVIIQERIVGKATRFFLENDLKNIDIETTKTSTENPTTTEKATGRKKRVDQSVKSDHTSTENPTTHQSENTDINKNYLLSKNEVSKNEYNNSVNSALKQELSIGLRLFNIEHSAIDIERLITASKGDHELIKQQIKNFGDRGIGYLIASVRDKYTMPKKNNFTKETESFRQTEYSQNHSDEFLKEMDEILKDVK